MKRFFSVHLPAVNDILLTFAFTAFLVYGRLLFVFTWKLPSWLKLLTPGEILVILSYSFVFSFLETAGIVFVLLLIGFILPAPRFRNFFAVSGVWLVSVCLISLMIFFGSMDSLLRNLVTIFPIWTVVTIILAALAAIVAPRVRFMRAAALWFSDRTIIFLYLFVPASAIGLLVVIVREIFAYGLR